MGNLGLWPSTALLLAAIASTVAPLVIWLHASTIAKEAEAQPALLKVLVERQHPDVRFDAHDWRL